MSSLAGTAGPVLILNSTLALLTDSIRLCPILTGYTPLATHDHMDDITNEVNGTNCTSGFAGTNRAVCGTPAVSIQGANAKFSSANVVYTSVNGATPVGMVIYKHLTSDAVSDWLFWIDQGFPVTYNGSTVTYAPDATNGWVYLQ
jgi:hypothetical protein